MEVVLLENIKNLGQIGDVVGVKRGHARNFLIKYGKALKASEENGNNNNIEKIKEGIDLILNKINKRFEELEVASFTKPGDIVNPELHDALMMRTEDGKDENEILEVFEKGYRYKDRVIRHAKVVVNQTPS